MERTHCNGNSMVSGAETSMVWLRGTKSGGVAAFCFIRHTLLDFRMNWGGGQSFGEMSSYLDGSGSRGGITGTVFIYNKQRNMEFSLWLSGLRTRLVSMRMWVQSLASLSALRILHCHKLECRSQIWLRSGVTVAVMQASSCNSDLTSSPGTSICCRCGCKKKKKLVEKFVFDSEHLKNTID